MVRQGLASISTMVLNAQAAIYGDAAIAADECLYREFLCLFSVWHLELVRDFNRFRRSIMEQENIRGCARRFGLPYFLDWLIW